eukprot:GFUD01033272.1.p1 GENE.GFUD01033272.1~~GFUD01033272.1.p1  ORF type:complete len:334 (-),score=96.46 GFUD01033272.1:94-1095(-)
MTMSNIVQCLGDQTCSVWKPTNQNCVALNTNTSHLMRFKYDVHDVTVAFSNTSPDLGELRVGQTFKFTGPTDRLEISVLKTAVRGGKVKEVDFELRLGKGGVELVFVYVEETHLTIKGHNFAGESSSHILFKSLLFPFLQRKVMEPPSTVKKEVKIEVNLLEIIDLTNENDEDKEAVINVKREKATLEELDPIDLTNENDDKLVLENTTRDSLKREWYEEATLEEFDPKKMKTEHAHDQTAVKGEAGPPPSTTHRRLLKPSPTLASLLPTGPTPVSRSEILKGLWVYIKQWSLQDPNEKPFFTPNLAMQTIFGTDRIRGCSMGKYIKKHLTAL